MPSFDGFPTSDFEVISPEGDVRNVAKGIISGNEIVVFDEKLVVFAGDEMRRALPNGHDEAFHVVDPQFFTAFGGIPSNYQIKVRRKGTFPHHTGGNFSISVTGPNARVNIGSTDNSKNVVGDVTVFRELRAAVSSGVSDEGQRAELLAAVEAMDAARGHGGFVQAYQRFISLAADHLGVIGPFLPALAGFLASGT